MCNNNLTNKLSEEELFEKARLFDVSDSILKFVEHKLDSKICEGCAKIYDSSDFNYYEEQFASTKFCLSCGGKLNESWTLDDYFCYGCDTSLAEEGEGYISPNREKGSCEECYDALPIRTIEEEKKHLAKLEFDKKFPLRMISPFELNDKKVIKTKKIKWNDAIVTYTEDNCICCSYEYLDPKNQITSTCFVSDLEEFKKISY